MKKLLLIFLLISFSSLGAEKVTIKDAKTSKILQVAEFEGSKAKQEWIDMLEKTSAWGKAAHKKCEDTFPSEAKHCVDIPSEYTIEILDITAEVEAERTKKETKRSDRLTRIEQLKAINWAEIDTVKELKEIVKLLAKEAIKDEE